jgi:protein TonB
MPELPDLVPLPEPPPPLPPPPVTPPTPPRPRQLARPQYRPTPRNNPSGFPAPQDWSFGGGQLSRPSQQGAGGQSLMAGPSIPTPHITGAQLGRDWIAAYSAWVQAHLYYPEQAALNNEDGTTEVAVEIDRTGKVLSVQLITRSGSQWLDLSTTGMFRGAHVPPFPQDTKENTATVDQTIHYILQRR